MERWVKRTIEFGAGLAFSGKSNPSVIPFYPQKTEISGDEEQYFRRVSPERAGVSSGRLLAMLKAANTGMGFWPVMLMALSVMLVVQLIQDMLLVPRIMGKRMNLHPAVILLSLSIWGKLLGLLGMIVALPLTTILLAYLKRYHEIAESSKSDEEQILKKAINSANVTPDKE